MQQTYSCCITLLVQPSKPAALNLYYAKQRQIKYDVSWMNIILFTTIKLSENKLRPFEHTQSMSKWPTGLVYVGNIINYLLYLLAPRGIEVDLEGSSTFLTLILSMHIDRLGLVTHLYGCLFNCITMWKGSWAGAKALYIKVGWHCTIAVSDWGFVHQLPGCEEVLHTSHASKCCIYEYILPYAAKYICI